MTKEGYESIFQCKLRQKQQAIDRGDINECFPGQARKHTLLDCDI